MIFHIVEFTSNLSKEKTIIPDTWMSINNNTCAMPPGASAEQLEEATKNQLEPEDGWEMYSIKSLMTFESYDEAKDYLQKFLSEDEPRRKRKKPSYLSNYTSMDSDEEQNTSKSPKVKIVATCIKREEKEREEVEMEELSDIEWIPSAEENEGPRTSNKEPSSAFQQEMLNWMEKIHSVLQQNTRILEGLYSHLTNQQIGSENSIDDIPKLPLQTLEEMVYFEEYLEGEPNFKKMVQYFSGKGGNDTTDCTRRIMKSIMTPRLATCYNWAGRGEKIPFKNTRVKQLVIDAIRENKHIHNVDEKLIEEQIKSVLKYAPLRLSYMEKKNWST